MTNHAYLLEPLKDVATFAETRIENYGNVKFGGDFGKPLAKSYQEALRREIEWLSSPHKEG